MKAIGSAVRGRSIQLFALVAVILIVCFAVLLDRQSQSWFTSGPEHSGRWSDYQNGRTYRSRTSISPDGNWIVYSSPAQGEGNISKISLPDRAIHKLTETDDCEADPAWSPHGDRIVYCRESNKASHVWMMKQDGTEQTQVTFGAVFDSRPAFFPDGRKIVFSREQTLGKLSTNALIIRNLESGDERSLKSMYSALSSPTVHPDGTKLIAASWGKLVEIDIETGSGRILADGYAPRYCFDGDVLFVSGVESTATQYELFRLCTKLSKPVQITHFKGRLTQPSISRYGTLVVMDELRANGRGTLYLCEPTEGTLRAVLDTESGTVVDAK